MTLRRRPIADLSPSEKRALLTELLANKAPERSSTSWPALNPRPQERFEPFPLTETQQAYWVGQTDCFTLGRVAEHMYQEFDVDALDIPRFAAALNRLIAHHEMLRAVVLPEGRQKILEFVPLYEIEVLDLSGQTDAATVETALTAVRRDLSHQARDPARWPLFEVRAARLDGSRTRLYLSFNLLIADAWSLQLLWSQLILLYRNPTLPLPDPGVSFRDYVLAEASWQDSEECLRSRDYWFRRLESLPSAPELPLTVHPRGIDQPQFSRLADRLDPADWLSLKERANQAEITPSGLLLAAFSTVLGIWSRSKQFTITLTLFNRLPIHPQINEVVGDFTSLILFAVDVSNSGSFLELARSIQHQLWNDLEHRHFSGVRVLREMARVHGRSPLDIMPVVFTSTLAIGAQPGNLFPEGRPIYQITQTPQVWLDHQVVEQGGALVFNWDAVEGLYPSGLLPAMFNWYGSFLRRLALDPETWTRPVVDLVCAEETHAPNVVPGDDLHAEPPALRLHDLFAARARARPDHPAVIAADGTLTYDGLLRRARLLGRSLRRLGARPETLVAVVMEKGWAQVAAVLGVHESGAAYLPIDPEWPRKRIQGLLRHGEVELILTQSYLDPRLDWPAGTRRLLVDSPDFDPAVAPNEECEPLEPAGRPEDLAYVIYTSGSTGQPKGVMVEHRSAVNTVLDINGRFGVGPDDRVFGLSSLSFDLSVYDIVGTLAAGATLVLPAAGAIRDPSVWADALDMHNITIWNSVPALMQLLLDSLVAGHRPCRPPLRLTLLSGDWIPLTMPNAIKSRFPGANVVSLGGATEAAIWSICHPIAAVAPDASSIPYGRALRGQEWHVRDEQGRPCPVWVTGQLHIGGAGLARGYWRDEERTRESFFDDAATGRRLYRTGDLGRFRPDGEIELLGRDDFQVKINGQRIELGEIEAALLSIEGINAVAVNAEGQLQGSRRLVAHIIADSRAGELSDNLIRASLGRALPASLIPSAFVRHERLPLTANGKVDRRLLETRSTPPREAASEGIPSDEMTMTIGAIVAHELQRESIEPTANLMNLGANSMDLVRIATRIEQQFGFRPRFGDFFRQPTVEGITQSLLGQERAAATSPVSNALPTSPTLVLEPEARAQFRRPQLRPMSDNGRPATMLAGSDPDAEWKTLLARRRSHRTFSSLPIAAEAFGRFLECLRAIGEDGRDRHLYGSAGGLYAVRPYLHLKPGRIAGIHAGAYVYDAGRHRLILTGDLPHLDPGVHEPLVNRAIFEAAAFSIFLVAQVDAIAPLYGDAAMHFAAIEAGLICQLLETHGPDTAIGLCQIGALNFEPLRDAFGLVDGQELVHSMVGGYVLDRASSPAIGTNADVLVMDEGEI
jgi:pyochelin synthetase